MASSDMLAPLRRPTMIRARCAAVTRSVDEGRSPWFVLDRARLDDAAALVDEVTRERYPDGRIPYHSRWRQFEAGGVDRKAELDALLAGRSPGEQARARFDLIVPSVLLDAGAGAAWRYQEHAAAPDALALPVQRRRTEDLFAMLDQVASRRTGAAEPAAAAGPPAAAPAGGGVYTRSEGLGIATLRAFVGGIFSGSKDDPLRSDAATLRLVDAAVLRSVFQVSAGNPLVGLEGRAGLMSRLGSALAAAADGTGLEPRPALIYELLTDGGTRAEVGADELLDVLLRTLAPVWTGGGRVLGLPAGDVWPHRWAGADDGVGGSDRTTGGHVPFHKLSQWLAYSLLEPLQWSGVRVRGIEALTGLPEYRNGGLLIDTGVIVPRHPQDLDRRWKVGDEPVIEWRALTVTLLDELAARLRLRLGLDAEALPLACVLEGGSWAAGRRIAERLRGGNPPLQIDSDGTVF